MLRHFPFTLMISKPEPLRAPNPPYTEILLTPLPLAFLFFPTPLTQETSVFPSDLFFLPFVPPRRPETTLHTSLGCQVSALLLRCPGFCFQLFPIGRLPPMESSSCDGIWQPLCCTLTPARGGRHRSAKRRRGTGSSFRGRRRRHLRVFGAGRRGCSRLQLERAPLRGRSSPRSALPPPGAARPPCALRVRLGPGRGEGRGGRGPGEAGEPTHTLWKVLDRSAPEPRVHPGRAPAVAAAGRGSCGDAGAVWRGRARVSRR